MTAASAAETQALGAALGRALGLVTDAPVVIAIEGELGAGKTTLVQGVMRALGVTSPVRSPTYTLLEPYTVAERSIYHLDLYRIAEPREVEALGVRDLLLHDAVLLVEWPSRAGGLLPNPDLAISMSYADPGGRHIVLRAGSDRGARVLAATLPVSSE